MEPTPKHGILADLFAGPGNLSWDLGRWLCGVFTLYMGVGLGWNIHMRQPIDLGPTGLGGGVAAILTGGGLYLAAKAWAKKKNAQAETETNTGLPEGEPTQVEVINTPANPVPTTEGEGR